MLGRVHVLVNVQQHCSCVYSRSGRSHMCRLACNVYGGITAVVFSRRRFFELTLLWISLDQHGILAVLSPLGSQHRLDFSVIYLSVGHLNAVLTTSQHHLCSTEVSSASLLSSARSVTTSTNIDRHVTGIKYPYFNHKIVSRASSRFLANHIYMCFSQFRCPSVGHRISQFLTTHIPTVIHVC